MSLEMEKTLKEQSMSDEEKDSIKAQKVLEINPNHELFKAFSSIQDNEELVKDYASILYDEANLLEGREVTNKVEFVQKLNSLILKALNK